MGYYYRSWACPCCGREWHRYKDEKRPYWSGHCSVCPRQLVKARVARVRKECVHERAAARVAKATLRLEARPRTRHGRLLSPPGSVKALWREVRRAKTRPAVARRGAKFVAALLAYSRSAPPTNRLVYQLNTKGKVITKPINGSGMASPPKVRLDDKMPSYVWGEYRRALLRGRYEIALNPDAPSCDHLRATLIHEIQHVLDDDVRLKDQSHGAHWNARLAVLAKMFPPEALR